MKSWTTASATTTPIKMVPAITNARRPEPGRADTIASPAAANRRIEAHAFPDECQKKIAGGEPISRVYLSHASGRDQDRPRHPARRDPFLRPVVKHDDGQSDRHANA